MFKVSERTEDLQKENKPRYFHHLPIRICQCLKKNMTICSCSSSQRGSILCALIKSIISQSLVVLPSTLRWSLLMPFCVACAASLCRWIWLLKFSSCCSCSALHALLFMQIPSVYKMMRMMTARARTAMWGHEGGRCSIASLIGHPLAATLRLLLLLRCHNQPREKEEKHQKYYYCLFL